MWWRSLCGTRIHWKSLICINNFLLVSSEHVCCSLKSNYSFSFYSSVCAVTVQRHWGSSQTNALSAEKSLNLSSKSGSIIWITERPYYKIMHSSLQAITCWYIIVLRNCQYPWFALLPCSLIQKYLYYTYLQKGLCFLFVTNMNIGHVYTK